MNKMQILASILGLLLLVSGFLLYDKYWDTWAKYEEEITMEMANNLITRGIPADLADKIAACLASKTVKALNESNCSIPKNDENISTAIEICFMIDAKAFMAFNISSIKCISNNLMDNEVQP